MYQTINGKRGYRIEIKNKKLYQDANIFNHNINQNSFGKSKRNLCISDCMKMIKNDLKCKDLKRMKVAGALALGFLGGLFVRNSFK